MLFVLNFVNRVAFPSASKLCFGRRRYLRPLYLCISEHSSVFYFKLDLRMFIDPSSQLCIVYLWKQDKMLWYLTWFLQMLNLKSVRYVFFVSSEEKKFSSVTRIIRCLRFLCLVESKSSVLHWTKACPSKEPYLQFYVFFRLGATLKPYWKVLSLVW